MFDFIFKIVCLILLLMVIMAHGSTFIPDNITMVSYDKKYMKGSKAFSSVYKVKGRPAYFINIESEILQPWGDNITIFVSLTEINNNPNKKPFFVVNQKLCVFFHNTFLGKIFTNKLKGILKRSHVCPLPPGVYRMYNMTSRLVGLPGVPFTRTKVDCQLTNTETKETIVAGYGYLSVID